MKKHNYFVKLAALALALVLILSLTACGGGSTTNGDGGDEQKPVIQIAVPNDTTNEARALLLLEQEGLIKLKEDAGLNATKESIVENPHNYNIVELEAKLLPETLQDVDVSVINGNYAIGAGLKVSDALATESAEGLGASTFANIIAVKEGNEDNAAVKALLDVLQSDAVKAFIEETYQGAVVPVF